MRMLTCAGVLLVAGMAGAAGDTAGTALFDGKTLTGWKRLGGAADYQIKDGAIVGATRPNVPNSFLVTEKTFGDFILELDVRQDVGPANSGVQFRSLSTADFQDGRVHGYQADIDPSPRQWSGHIYEEAQRGWFYTGEMNPPSKALYKFGEWNHYRIEAIGPRLRVCPRTAVGSRPVAFLPELSPFPDGNCPGHQLADAADAHSLHAFIPTGNDVALAVR